MITKFTMRRYKVSKVGMEFTQKAIQSAKENGME